ncbi:MAG: hypothetical protein H7Z14_06405, partial [Anaerolineae bacterium]|nr:hypothetical protein [Phycisphaerae bacterium]
VFGWAWFMNSGPFDVIWRMFGIANQMLAVMALAIVSAYLSNTGKRRYLWVTILPMLLVLTTTTTGAIEMSLIQINTISAQLAKAAGTRDAVQITNATLLLSLIAVMLICGLTVVLASANRIWRRPDGDDPQPPRVNLLEPVIAGK